MVIIHLDYLNHHLETPDWRLLEAGSNITHLCMRLS